MQSLVLVQGPLLATWLANCEDQMDTSLSSRPCLRAIGMRLLLTTTRPTTRAPWYSPPGLFSSTRTRARCQRPLRGGIVAAGSEGGGVSLFTLASDAPGVTITRRHLIDDRDVADHHCLVRPDLDRARRRQAGTSAVPSHPTAFAFSTPRASAIFCSGA